MHKLQRVVDFDTDRDNEQRVCMSVMQDNGKNVEGRKNVDKETVNYIRHYFSNLMTDDEKLALKYHMYTYKTEDPKMRKLMVEKDWISEQPEIQKFLKDGYDDFELRTALRIITESADKIFFNNCPKCKRLARTPYARQCRHCGHAWHELTAAQFKLESTFQLTNRPFFLLGQITKGKIMEGQFIDLTMLGLNKKPKIEIIEFALKSQDGKVREDIALGTNDLTEQEKAYVKRIHSFGRPFDIVKER